eukprot:6462226-Amphidinium_carterae.1
MQEGKALVGNLNALLNKAGCLIDLIETDGDCWLAASPLVAKAKAGLVDLRAWRAQSPMLTVMVTKEMTQLRKSFENMSDKDFAALFQETLSATTERLGVVRETVVTLQETYNLYIRSQ